MDFKDQYIIVNDVFIEPKTVKVYTHHYGKGINCLEVLHGNSIVTRFYEEDMNDFLKQYNSYCLRNQMNKPRSELKSFPKLDGNIAKGIISVGEKFENVVIDAKIISLMYFDNKPEKIKLNILLGSQDERIYFEDDLAFEFIDKYNQFLNQ